MSRMLSFVEHLGKMGRDIDYWIDSANYHAHNSHKAEALMFYRRAADAGGDNPEIVARVAEGLRGLGEMDEAGEILHLATFSASTRSPVPATLGKTSLSAAVVATARRSAQVIAGAGSDPEISMPG